MSLNIDFKMDDLPSMPPIAAKILELLSDEETSAGQLNQVITRDPSLTTKLLKISNSAFYGHSREIKTLTAAIMVLGFRTIKDLVLAVSLRDYTKRFGLTEKMLWEHSVGTAIAAHMTARELKLDDWEEAFISGLLHDIGKLALNMLKSKEFTMVMQLVYNKDVPFIDAERKVLGYDHSLIGAELIRQWKLPAKQEYVAAYHHNLERAHSHGGSDFELILLVNFADLVSHYLGFGQRSPQSEVDLKGSALARKYSLEAEQIDRFTDEIQTAFQQERSIFGA